MFEVYRLKILIFDDYYVSIKVFLCLFCAVQSLFQRFLNDMSWLDQLGPGMDASGVEDGSDGCHSVIES